RRVGEVDGKTRERLDDAEVEELRSAKLSVHDDVRRLDVAMDDVVLFEILRGVSDLRQQRRDPLDRNVLRNAVERVPLDVFHQKVEKLSSGVVAASENANQ